jgi:hypothetical protein
MATQCCIMIKHCQYIVSFMNELHSREGTSVKLPFMTLQEATNAALHIGCSSHLLPTLIRSLRYSESVPFVPIPKKVRRGEVGNLFGIINEQTTIKKYCFYFRTFFFVFVTTSMRMRPSKMPFISSTSVLRALQFAPCRP